MRDIGVLRAKNGYFLLTLALWCCYLDYMNYLQWEDLVSISRNIFQNYFQSYSITKLIKLLSQHFLAIFRVDSLTLHQHLCEKAG